MKHETVKSGIPQPLANYSEACIAGDLVFAAGQLASDFKTGVPQEARRHANFPYYGSDIKLQTEYILKNCVETFKAAGSSLDHVVKAQVFLMNLNDFAAFDEVWKQYFKVPPPRTTVGTTGLLVKDTLVEIDLIGVAANGPKIEKITSNAPRPLANYSEAFRVGDLVFAAGQIASDYKTGVPAEARKGANFPYYGSDIQLQTDYILRNLAQTFEAAGSSLEHVVKAQVFLTDLNNFAGFDEVWRRYFKVPPPRTTVGTSGLLVKDTLVEIDLIGYVPRQGLSSRGDQIRSAPAAGELFGGHGCRRLRLCGRTAGERLPDGRSVRSAAYRRTFRITARTSSCRPISSSRTCGRRSRQREARWTRSSRRRCS